MEGGEGGVVVDGDADEPLAGGFVVEELGGFEELEAGECTVRVRDGGEQGEEWVVLGKLCEGLAREGTLRRGEDAELVPCVLEVEVEVGGDDGDQAGA